MIGWLAETFVAVTALMLVVLALRRPVARLFGAGWAYALWAIPALRLILPPIPSLTPEISFPTAMSFIPMSVGETAPLTAQAGPGQWLPIMLVMWASGAVLFLLHQRRAYCSFVERLDADSRPGSPPNHGSVRLLVSGAVDGPLALGLLDRRIVFPADFYARYTEAERRLAIAHELTHHRRGDLWWSLAAVTILALNWFNPVAWIAFRAFRADQELACDAVVAAGATAEERCDYAKALVKSASRPGLIAACALNSTSQLKHRLKMMGRHRASLLRRAGGLATVSTAGIAALGLAAPVPVADQPASQAIAPSPSVAGSVPLAEPAAESASAAPSAFPHPRRAVAAEAKRPRARPVQRALRAEHAAAKAASPASAESAAPTPAAEPAGIPVAVATATAQEPQIIFFTRVTRVTRVAAPTDDQIRAILHRVRAVQSAQEGPPILLISEAQGALRRVRLTTRSSNQGE